MEIQKLLDECMKITGSETDYQLAKKTGLSEARLSDYRRGERLPNSKDCFIISDILKIDAKILIAEFEMQGAKSEKTKEFWSKKLRALGGMAASVAVLIVTLIMTNMVPAPAQAAPMLGSDFTKNQSIHYAKYALWVRAIKRQLLLLLEKSKIGLCSLVACVCQPTA